MFSSIDEDIVNKQSHFENVILQMDEQILEQGENQNEIHSSQREVFRPNSAFENNLDETLINHESFGNENINSENVNSKTYRNFDTIDWLEENIDSKLNSLKIKEKLKENKSFYNTARFLFEKSSGWFVILSIGIFGGLMIPCIIVGGEWILDIRQGYCITELSNNYYDCCRLNHSNYSYSKKCVNWTTWGQAIGINNNKLLFAFDYTLYVLLSVILAWLSAEITFTLAPYACGSGITEVQTILSGFVIKQFLGIRTSIVKFMTVLLSIGSGLNVSHEGVMIHLCSSIANLISFPIRKFNSNEAKRREVIEIFVVF